jgi:hypothetical protein
MHSGCDKRGLNNINQEEFSMSDQKQSFWTTPQGFAAIGLIASVSYFLLVEHRQHVFEFLPYPGET